MSRLRQKTPPFQGVGAGQKATCILPVGLTYDVITLRYQESGTDANEATMKAGIEKVRLLIDGEAKIDLTGAELLDIYKYYGYSIKAGRLPLIFARPWARSPVGEDILAYGTKDVSTMTLEVDIASSATSPSLTGRAVQNAGRPLGQHVTLKSYSESASGAGVVENASIPRGAGYWQLAMHIASPEVTGVELIANNQRFWEGEKSDDEFVDSLYGKVPQTGYYHVNNVASDRVAGLTSKGEFFTGGLNLNLEDYRIKMTMSDADSSFNLIQERLEIDRRSNRNT